MAVLKTTSGNSSDVEENASLIEAAESVGVDFSCRSGVCGACLVRVHDGMDNMSALSEQENNYGLEDGQRLMCCSSIKAGEVTISLED